MKKIFLLAIVAISLLTCNETEITPREYPRTRTLEVFNINQDGASFKGEIYFASVEITDHGFLISESKNPSFSSAEKISLGKKSGIGEFSATIDRSLITGKEYFVRAYAKSADHTVYGDVIGFTSLGSKAPILNKISPNEGTWRDTLYLTGENFSKRPGIMELKFGTHKAWYAYISTDSLMTIVPVEVSSKLSDLSLKFDGSISKIENGFKLLPPEIISVIPEVAKVGEVITINGKNFSQNFSSIKINGVEAQIISKKTNEITAKIPVGIQDGEAAIVVTTGEDLISNSYPIEIDGLLVFGMEPSTGTFYDVIKIRGKGFGNTIYNLKVFFDEENYGYSPIIDISDTEISIHIPALTKPESTIRIENNIQQSGTSPGSFKMNTPIVNEVLKMEGGSLQIIGDNFFPGLYYNKDSPQMKVYMGTTPMIIVGSTRTEIIVIDDELPTHQTNKIKVEVANQVAANQPEWSYPWIKKAAFPEESLGVSIFNWEDKAYVGLGKVVNSHSRKLWKYDNNADSWSSVASFPGIERNYASNFIIGDKGYLFGGFNDSGFPVNDYWIYDRITDQWSKVADLPVVPDGYWNGFQLNGKIFGIQTKFTLESTLWYLDETTQTWISKGDLPFGYDYYYSDHVAIGNKLYIASGSRLWIYDNLSDSWTDEPLLIYNSWDFSSQKINDHILFISHGSSEIMDYDPPTKSWSTRTHYKNYYSQARTFTLNGFVYLIHQSKILKYDPAFE